MSLNPSSLKPRLSAEFFPSKTETGQKKLFEVARALAVLEPEFYSVTYGAGGSSKQSTLEILEAFDACFETIPCAGHLTCVGACKAEVNAVIKRYAGLGLRHIVALRGDPPEGVGRARYTPHPGGYASSWELVAAIKAQTPDVRVSVGAYPEKHPESATLSDDIEMLKRKQEAGADEAITQFFFDNEAFERFRQACVSNGVHIPLIAGILPIHNFKQVCAFASKCGTHIPDALTERFGDENLTQESMFEVSSEITALQIEDLIKRGVEHLHFYSMNRADLTLNVCELAGLVPKHNGEDKSLQKAI